MVILVFKMNIGAGGAGHGVTGPSMDLQLENRMDTVSGASGFDVKENNLVRGREEGCCQQSGGSRSGGDSVTCYLRGSHG